MSEIFLRERPDSALPFTGERLTTSQAGQIEIEHLHRYFLARALSRGKQVLDIACGEGYGAALLAQVAASVLGIDVSPETVAHAQAAYCKPNLTFRLGDARHIDAPDGSVDVATSFETLEHFAEHERFYAELRRVLRPGGVLLISTPDQRVYSPDGSDANRYHVRELTQDEFVGGLRQVFPHVQLLLQRPMLGSVMLPAVPGDTTAPALTFEQRGPDAFEANTGLPRALYLVAAASDRPVSLPSASLYVETSQLAHREGEVLRLLAEWDAQAARRMADCEARYQAVLAERATALAQLRGECEAVLAQARARCEVERANSQAHHIAALAEMQAQHESALADMRASTSWRITAPLRLASRQARRLIPERRGRASR